MTSSYLKTSRAKCRNVDALNTSDYIHHRMLDRELKNGLKWMWKETVVACFKTHYVNRICIEVLRKITKRLSR